MPTPRRYTKRQKATAVIAAEMATVAAAAEQTGVPESTLRYWMDHPKFAELRAKTRDEMAQGMSVIAAMAQARIMAALEAGNFEPRDLTILLGVAIDKAQLLSGHATERTEHRELLADFDDHERDAMEGWLHEVARKRLEDARAD